MPFTVTTPSALGSIWDYDIGWEDPEPDWEGTQTWTQLITSIQAATGYGTDIVDRIRNTYFIRKRLRFVGIDMLVPLEDAVVMCELTGLLGFHAGSDVQFGQSLTILGVETGTRGCTIVEDEGSGSREGDNFNKTTRIVMNSTLRMYDTTFRRKNSTRSDFDWSTDSLIVMRDVVLQMRGTHFNHFYGKMDIKGLEIQTTSGSNLEFRTAPDDFIAFDDVYPYRLDGNVFIRSLVLFLPLTGTTNNSNVYTFNDYKGVNFARWSLGARFATFINPYVTDLQSTGGTSGASGHAFEKRTLRVEVKDPDNQSIEAARVQIQHRVDGYAIPEGWLMEDQFPYDVNTVTEANGVINTMLNRRYWRHASPRQQVGGLNIDWHVYHDLTPHIMKIYKYGFLPVEQPVDVTPTGPGSGGFSLAYSMLEDEHVPMDKATALALQSSMTITTHSTPITWESKEWDVTIATNLPAADVYQWVRAVQDAGVEISGDFLPNIMPTPTESARGLHGREIKAFRFITTSGSAIVGLTRMQSKDGTYYIPPVATILTIAANVSLVDAEVRLYDLDDLPAGSLGTELAGVENNPSTTFTYSGVSGNLIAIQIMQDGYKEFLQEFTMPSTDTTLTVRLDLDLLS